MFARCVFSGGVKALNTQTMERLKTEFFSERKTKKALIENVSEQLQSGKHSQKLKQLFSLMHTLFLWLSFFNDPSQMCLNFSSAPVFVLIVIVCRNSLIIDEFFINSCELLTFLHDFLSTKKIKSSRKMFYDVLRHNKFL